MGDSLVMVSLVTIVLGSTLFAICLLLDAGLTQLFSNPPWITDTLRQIEGKLDEMNRITDEEAITRVENLIRDHDTYQIEEPTSALQNISVELPPLVRVFFQKYASIHMEVSRYTLSRRLIGPSKLDPRFLRIGILELDNWEIVVKGKEEAVYILDGVPESKEPYGVIAKSVFHFVLLEHNDVL